MKETSISLENAGSSLTEWVRRARREHTTFVVLDATKPIARLIPAESPRCTGAELARVWAAAGKPGETAGLKIGTGFFFELVRATKKTATVRWRLGWFRGSYS